MKLSHIGTISALAAGLAVTSAAPAHAAPTCAPAKTFTVPGYPAGTSGIFPWENGGYDKAVARDTATLTATVEAYADACPGPIHLRGHSYGARVVGDATLNLDQGEHADRITTTLTGDPRHPGGIEDRLEGISIAGITMTGTRPTTDVIPVDARCNPHDGICDFTARGILGYLTGAHRYPAPAN